MINFQSESIVGKRPVAMTAINEKSNSRQYFNQSLFPSRSLFVLFYGIQKSSNGGKNLTTNRNFADNNPCFGECNKCTFTPVSMWR